MQQPSHPTEDQFVRYHARALAPAELLEVADHVAQCDACRDRLYIQEQAAVQLRALRADVSRHLEYEEIVAAAEGAAPASLERHLADCGLCRAEVDDLRNFRTGLKREAQAPIPMPVSPAKPSRWRMAMAAALVLLAAGLSIRFPSPGHRSPQPAPVAASQQPPRPSEAPLTATESAAVETALAGHRLERSPVLDRVITRRGVLLGAAPAAASFDLIGPMGTAVISDRPLFRWSAAPGATGYVVAIFDENFAKVTASPALTGSEWQPDQPLRRGRVYNWQVTATIGGKSVNAPVPPAPEARFQVVTTEAAAEIEAAQREHPANHVLLAALYAKAGDLDDAARELDALSATDPATAAPLKESLDRLRRR